MRILVIGSGGREHALVWKIMQSPEVSAVFVAPGNGGTSSEGAVNVPIAVDDLDGLLAFARKEHIDLVIPGPELPLTLGVVDRMREAGIPALDPTPTARGLKAARPLPRKS